MILRILVCFRIVFDVVVDVYYVILWFSNIYIVSDFNDVLYDRVNWYYFFKMICNLELICSEFYWMWIVLFREIVNDVVDWNVMIMLIFDLDLKLNWIVLELELLNWFDSNEE